MKDLGVDKSYITLFWAAGSVLEIVMFTQAGKLLRRFGTKWFLAIGMLGVAVRLSVYAFFPSVTVVFLIQGMHAFTFAAVHASTVTFVNYAAPAKWRSSAQTIFEGISIGLSTVVGAFLGGLVSDRWGYSVLFMSAGAAAVLAAGVFMILAKPVPLDREDAEKAS